MGFKVEALQSGRWRDGAARVEHDVRPGDVVEFREAADASYFADGARGRWWTPGETIAPAEHHDADKVKPRRGRKPKGDGDA